jgi:hypothetical protein
MTSQRLKLLAVTVLVVSIVGIALVIPAIETMHGSRSSDFDPRSRELNPENFKVLREQKSMAIDDAYRFRKIAVYVGGGAGVALGLVLLLWSRDKALIEQ